MKWLEEYGETEILQTDITLLGFGADPWDFSRGARTERNYRDDDGLIVVQDKYTYEMDAGNRNITKIVRHIHWVDETGATEVQKDITQAIDAKKLKAINREVRQGRIDYLEAAAEDMRTMSALYPEPYKTGMLTVADSIDAMFEHYAAEATAYITRGTMAFEDAVRLGEGPMQPILYTVPNPATGWTVRDSILFQLTGEVPNVT